MIRFIDGDLQGLELPRDLRVLQAEAEKAILDGLPLKTLYSSLSQRHPVALGELAVGPRALRGDLAAEAAMEVLDALEKALSAKGLYPRLIKLHPNLGPTLAEVALERFPEALWAQTLGEDFSIVPGLRELGALRGAEGYEEACVDHARQGHQAALLEHASLGELEPIAALLLAGQEEAALRAAAIVLAEHPQADVTAWFAAAAGPKCERLLCQLIPHLRSKSAIESLQHRASPYPRAELLLRTLLPAVR